MIDFHTHAFPTSLAEKAMSVLLESIDNLYTPVTDGTLAGLLRNMNEWNIDISVVLPVVTKESQARKTNIWAKEICSEKIICFGGIYPHSENCFEEIDFIAESGLKGIKFHPEYQDFILDDKKMLKIYDYALSKGLILVFHAGFDPAFPEPFRSSPERFANVLDAMKGGSIVAAHYGGHAQWDDVERYLVGRNIYLDTSMGFDYYSREQFLRIARNHGFDKILFASDSPWSNAKTEIEHIKSLGLSKNEMDLIFYKNAKKLLNI